MYLFKHLINRGGCGIFANVSYIFDETRGKFSVNRSAFMQNPPRIISALPDIYDLLENGCIILDPR